MKKLHIYIIGVCIVLLTSGCNISNEYETPPQQDEVQEKITNTSPSHFLLANIQDLPNTSAELILEEESSDPYTTVVTIKAKNPDQYNIQSVRTWLTYDPTTLKAVKIDTSNSPFQIAAPQENTIEEAFGLIKIGRANVSNEVRDEEIEIAKIVFVKKLEEDQVSIIDFYNHKGNKGNTQVNTVINKNVINISQKPQSPALIIKK